MTENPANHPSLSSSDYAAFISYSHEDAKTAAWLQRAIEHYAVPRRLVGRAARYGPIPRRLGKCFRDRDELPASPDLNTEILAAIARCRFMVVLCSPAAARSKWVDQEIIAFKRHRGADRIIAVITSGEPFAVEETAAQECFPAALRFQIDADGKLTNEPAEPVAADLRPDKDGKRMVRLKVLAGMLGVGLDELAQREAQRRQRVYGWVTGCAVALSAAFAGLALVAIEQRNTAIAAKKLAADRRDQAEGLLEFMVEDLHEKLKSVGRLEILDAVTGRALTYFASLTPEEMDATSAGQKTRVLGLIGNLQIQRGQQSQAEETYRQALQAAQAALAIAPNDPNRLYEYGRALHNLGFYYYFSSDIMRSQKYFSDALSYYKIALSKNDNVTWRREYGITAKNLGVCHFKQFKFTDALNLFDDSEKTFSSILSLDPSNETAISEYGDALAWQADARRWLGATRDAMTLRARQIQLFDSVLAKSSGNSDIVKMEINARRATALLKVDIGDYKSASADLVRAERDSERLYASDPENMEILERLVEIRLDLADIATLDSDFGTAERILQQANTDYEKMAKTIQGVTIRLKNAKAHADKSKALFFNATHKFSKSIATAEPLINEMRAESERPSPSQYNMGEFSNRMVLAFLAAEAYRSTNDQLHANEVYGLVNARISALAEPRNILLESIRAQSLLALGQDVEARRSLSSVCKTDFRFLVSNADCASR